MKQSDLSLRWAHMSEGTFSYVAAHMPLCVFLHLLHCISWDG